MWALVLFWQVSTTAVQRFLVPSEDLTAAILKLQQQNWDVTGTSRISVVPRRSLLPLGDVTAHVRVQDWPSGERLGTRLVTHIVSRFARMTGRCQVYFTYPFLRRLKHGKSLQRRWVNFSSHKLTFSARKIRTLQSMFLQNKNWLLVDKTLGLVRISLLISAIQS